VDVVAIERAAAPVPRWVRNTVLTVAEELENVEGENGWGQKQEGPEGRVCSCVLGWVGNLIARRTLTQPESDRDPERIMGEDKVVWDDENSWENSLTIILHFYRFGSYCAAESRL
jgi:hypothetical protein